MSMMGRHISRSGSSVHHQRQYSDHFSDASSKWLQSYNLSQSQDLGVYGSRTSRNGLSSGSDRWSPSDASPVGSKSSSLRKSGEDGVSPTELNPGLLDLQSVDTELLPEPVRGKSFDNSEPFSSDNKLNGNSLLKSLAADKERANNVAKIKVVVRKRPLNKKEMAKKEQDIITIEPNSNFLTVHETKFKVDLTEYVEKHEFVFNAVLDEDVSNEEVYSETVEPIVPLIFNKTKATCFAYGQTGSGKTYTMQPLPLKASQDILNLMHHTNQGFQLFVSFFEIYGGKVFDLLNDRKKLCMREDGKQQVCIVGLQEYRVSNVESIRELIEKGNATRSTGITGANEESSRSHAILQLCVKRSADGSESKPPRLVGKLSFIDLAGSERGADTTDNDKQTRMEGAEINKSLLALKECIRALDNDQGHIPFRGSKLTEVLRDSFVGDSRTVMISCISPSSGSCEHTLNTLRYADRVKSLSKGNSSRKDQLSSSSSLRESTALPLSSISQNESTYKDNSPHISNEKNRYGWAKQSERLEVNLSASVYSDYYMGQRGGQNGMSEDDFEANNTSSDYDLIALLKEEEDLVTAHRIQVEETMDIVKEEMNLLAQADQPGNQLDDYIVKLNDVISKKAAGIIQLQTQLVQFQRRLNEYNVLVSSSE